MCFAVDFVVFAGEGNVDAGVVDHDIFREALAFVGDVAKEHVDGADLAG